MRYDQAMDNQPVSPLAESANTPAKPRQPGVTKKLLFTLLAVLIFLSVLELSLRITGFRFIPNSLNVIVNGQTVAAKFRYTRDAHWTPGPNSQGPFHKFNADGFLGPHIPRRRVAGSARIATLGDSCTEFGAPEYTDASYPDVLRKLLAERWNQPVEILNAGVIGYTTRQGVRRLREDVLPYRPDVVTLYFGWNDHWIISRFTDAEKAAEAKLHYGWLDYVGWSRVVHLGLYGAHLVHEYRVWHIQQRPRVPRVPLDQYRANLRQMIALARQASAEPIVITAPTDITSTDEKNVFPGLTDYLDDVGYATPKAWHDAYAEAARHVAAQTKAHLLDAAKAFAGKPDLLKGDHIHLSTQGVQTMARLLTDAIDEVVDRSN